MDLEQRISTFCGPPIKVGRQKMDKQGWAGLIRRWQQEHFEIPELIGNEDISAAFNDGLYTIFGLFPNNSAKLLKQVFPDFGKATYHKCGVFVERQDAKSRLRLTNAFLSGEDRQHNAMRMLTYAYDEVWKKKYPLPEMIHSTTIKETLGTTLTAVFSLPYGKQPEALSWIIPDYAILTPQKADTLIALEKTTDQTKILVRLRSIYFQHSEQGRANARMYVQTYRQKYADVPPTYRKLKPLL